MFEPAGRRERKKGRTRRAILEAALRLFRARGFEAVTVAEICRDADVARGTFFQHFPSKAALLEAWGERLAEGLAAELAGPARSALAEARALVEWLGERWAVEPDLLGALVAGLLPGGAEPPALLGAVEAVLRRGQQRGELRRNMSPRLAAWLLLAGSAAVSAAGGRAGERARARDELLHALLHGLREPKPRVAWSPPAARPS